MREIVFDTETTGLDPEAGDRIVELGAVELSGHVPTGRTFHTYINPRRPMSPEAFEVHGLGDAFLADKPPFEEVVDGFLEFVGEARLVAHNAAFDMKFVNAELALCGRPMLPWSRVVDTLAIARKKHPGAGNSLDALCRRFGVDNSGREKHGALLDSEILAEVYLELIGGRQPGLTLGAVQGAPGAEAWRPRPRPAPLPPRITEGEAAAHAAFIAELGEGALWRRYG